MESLSNLPASDDEEETTNDEDVMAKLFGEPKEKVSTWKDPTKWKIIGISTIVFILLSNPWAQSFIGKLPYLGGNDLKTMTMTSVIFAILMIAAIMFAC